MTPTSKPPMTPERPDDLVVADWCQIVLPNAPEPEGAKLEEEIWRARSEETRLRVENEKLRQALESYGTESNWHGDMRQDERIEVFSPPHPDYRNEPGYKLARLTLGWEYPPPEPCENPSCDGVKDDLTDGTKHRCFKDGRWLDDGSEM